MQAKVTGEMKPTSHGAPAPESVSRLAYNDGTESKGGASPTKQVGHDEADTPQTLRAGTEHGQPESSTSSSSKTTTVTLPLRRLSMLASLADSDVYPGCMFTVDVSILNLRPMKNKVVLTKLGNNMMLASRAAKILSLSGTASSLFKFRFRSKNKLVRAGRNVKNVVHLGKDLDSYKMQQQQSTASTSDDAHDPNQAVVASASAADDDAMAGERPPTLRERIWSVMEDPEYKTIYSKVITITITILIIISVCVALLESLLMYADNKPARFFVIETICVTCFTIEFVLRMWSCPAPAKFITNWMNLIDLVAIAPYYIDIVFDQTVPGLTVFRVVRLARIMTLFKSARRQAKVYVETMRQSLSTMYLLFLIDVIGALVLATLIYYAERGSYDTNLQVWMRPESYTCEVIVRREWNLMPVTMADTLSAVETNGMDSSLTSATPLMEAATFGLAQSNTTSVTSTASPGAGRMGLDCLERGWEGACCTMASVQPAYLAALNSVLLLCPMRHNSPDLNCVVNYSQVR